VLQPLKAIRVEPSAQNGENRFIIGSGRMHVFSKKSLTLVLCRPPLLFVTFVLGIVLIAWGEIGGGVCLPRSQLNQNLSQRLTSGPTQRRKIHPVGGVAGRSVSTNFAEWCLQKFNKPVREGFEPSDDHTYDNKLRCLGINVINVNKNIDVVLTRFLL
jgi:hypothetical protein